MNNKFISALAVILTAGAANAADVTGEIEIVANDSGDVVNEITLDFTADGGIATAGIKMDETGITGYNLGTTVSGVTLSYGDQDDIMTSGGLRVVGGGTLADPTSADTSLIVGVDGAQILVGFSDGITDINNLQLGYTIGGLGATVDYNVDSTDITVVGSAGYEVAGIVGNALVSFDDSDNNVAYEVSAAVYGLTTYVNGDQDDLMQNIGAGWEDEIGDLTLFAEAEYNIDSGDVSPAVGISFAF
tara:strand:+ start:2480 stop:3214 length:735 start_codon:yes stop_codon:yes gene_type:complete